MCIFPLSQEELENLKNFKYKSTNESLLYNSCMSPFLNKVVNFLPYCLAPNIITLISLFFNIFAAVISYKDGGFDFSSKLKPSTCLKVGVFQLIYILLDNIDGKQARRTGNSTPFGMLMDHGCDIFTNILTAFNLSKLLIVGNNYYYSYTVFFGLFLGFYMMTYEEYKLEEMHFPIINGSDEGNFFIFLLGVFLYFFGPDYMLRKVSENYQITVGQLIGIIVVFGGFICVFNLYLHTYDKKGGSEMVKIFLDNIPFYSSIFVPMLYIAFNLDFYKENKWIVLCNASLIFARITIDIQVKIITMGNLTCNVMFIISNFIFITSLFVHVDIIKLYYLILLFVTQIVELVIFIYRRAKEITDFLEIKIFCINYNNQLYQV